MSSRQLRVEIKTSTTTQTIALDEGDSALVGREPNLPATHRVTVTSPNVSANHVEIRRSADEVSLVDLGSRNGTWLRLPAHSELRLALPVGDLALQIAPEFASAGAADAPEDTHWTTDYAGAIVDAVARWLERRDIPAKLTVVAGATARIDRPGRIPLATGQDLMVEPTRTTDSGWLQWLAVIERYVLRHNVLFETEQSMREDGLVVASPAMRRVVARVIEAAGSGAKVLLITGPSGSGKEGLARCFHRHTQRPGAFVARNCAMFSKEFVRSELFGAERGAYTGSVQRVVGAVEAAAEGTLFLDELGELPRDVQPMLLRFLDHGEYERLGGPASQRADVRIVCATNRDLRLASLSDEFRADLWFRLSVHVIEVPALLDRPEDLTAFMQNRSRDEGSFYDALEPAARALLAEHDWPGNFRELSGFVERVTFANPHGPITLDETRHALSEGSLRALYTAPSVPPDASTVTGQAERALHRFVADHQGPPRTWDDVKDFVENYFKPVMFAELSRCSELASFEAVELREAAERTEADRGTAMKQLKRYFDRFK